MSKFCNKAKSEVIACSLPEFQLFSSSTLPKFSAGTDPKDIELDASSGVGWRLRDFVKVLQQGQKRSYRLLFTGISIVFKQHFAKVQRGY